MTIPKIKSRVIIQHSKTCFAKGSKHEWSGFTSGYFCGNAFANEHTKHGNYHVWHKVTCNDTNCPAIKAVHSSILIEA